MSSIVCMPFQIPPGTNPAQCLAPSVQVSPTGYGSDGCIPTPEGVCTSGMASQMPVAGPDTEYFALGDTNLCCIAGDTMVTMGDGSQQAASTLSVGDTLAIYDRDWNEGTDQIRYIGRFNRPCIEISFGSTSLKCTPSHLFVDTDRKPIRASKVTVGMQVLGEGLSPVTITAVGLDQLRKVYRIKLSSGNSYSADLLITYPKGYV